MIIITKIIGVLYVIPFYKIIGPQGGTLYGYAYNIYNIFKFKIILIFLNVF